MHGYLDALEADNTAWGSSGLWYRMWARVLHSWQVNLMDLSCTRKATIIRSCGMYTGPADR